MDAQTLENVTQVQVDVVSGSVIITVELCATTLALDQTVYK
jgi:hypothetical protein